MCLLYVGLLGILIGGKLCCLVGWRGVNEWNVEIVNDSNRFVIFGCVWRGSFLWQPSELLGVGV